MPHNKVLVTVTDQFGNPLEATVTVDTGTAFGQQAAGQYVAGQIEPGKRTVQADAPACGCAQIDLEIPDEGEFEQHVIVPRFEIVPTPSATIPIGGVVKVGTSPPLTEPFSCAWDVIDYKKTRSSQVRIYGRTSRECIIDADLPPGRYAVQCTVRHDGYPTYSMTKKLDFTVEAATGTTAAQDQWEFYNRAKNLALIFKDNVDQKLDDLTSGVRALGQRIGGQTPPVAVQLLRPDVQPSATRPIWIAIKNRTEAMSVARLEEFLNRIFCRPGGVTGDPASAGLQAALSGMSSFHDVHSYELLRMAVEAFMIQECGVAIRPPRDPVTGRPGNGNGQVPEVVPPLTFAAAQQGMTTLLGLRSGRLPYIDKVVRQIFQGGVPPNTYVNPFCYGILAYRDQPCLIELIWSYWHEEAMLVQTMAAITRRFQNIRSSGERDPLTNLTLEPLRPLSNLLFGYLQDERDRLSVVRRAYEYDGEYGIRMVGRAVPVLRSADSRSKFLEAFHNLLFVTNEFYAQVDDTTVVADGFRVLNSLREVHLLLSQGAHNQYNDLVWRARAEMLLEQWLLGREELRQFLPSRPMVVYPERWMAQVDTMKSLQGWTDTSVLHFTNLARFGEQILLSIRFDDWNDPTRIAQDAADWALVFRPQIQGYTHEYRTVTGIDLTAPVADVSAAERYAQPSAHLRRRVGAQR